MQNIQHIFYWFALAFDLISFETVCFKDSVLIHVFLWALLRECVIVGEESDSHVLFLFDLFSR